MRFARSTLIVVAVSAALAALLPRAQVAAGRKTATTTSSSSNLVALHDPQSPGYDDDCLSCHASVLTEKSKDPRVPAIHPKMIPYTPGYNPRKGATNDVCVKCHRMTDTRDGSGAGLRVQVDRKLCVTCHGPTGPAKALYR